jgi:hypothetical protein
VDNRGRPFVKCISKIFISFPPEWFPFSLLIISILTAFSKNHNSKRRVDYHNEKCEKRFAYISNWYLFRHKLPNQTKSFSWHINQIRIKS